MPADQKANDTSGKIMEFIFKSILFSFLPLPNSKFYIPIGHWILPWSLWIDVVVIEYPTTS